MSWPSRSRSIALAASTAACSGTATGSFHRGTLRQKTSSSLRDCSASKSSRGRPYDDETRWCIRDAGSYHTRQPARFSRHDRSTSSK